MKKIFGLLSVGLAIVLNSCGDEQAPEAITSPVLPEKTDSSVATTIKVDTFYAQTDVSSVLWKASKPMKTHNGLIKISKGWLGLTNGKISEGAFTIDMKTIADLDLQDPKENKELIKDLSGKNFFDVQVYPTSEFVITAATDTSLTGNLTLKGKSNSITFPFKTVPMESKTSHIVLAKFSIDRSKWGIEYLGKSIVGIKPNDIVSDMIELNITLNVAKK